MYPKLLWQTSRVSVEFVSAVNNNVDKKRQRRVHGCRKDNHSFSSWRFYQKFLERRLLLVEGTCYRSSTIATQNKRLKFPLRSRGIGSTYDRCIFEPASRIAFDERGTTARNIRYTWVSCFNSQFADEPTAIRPNLSAVLTTFQRLSCNPFQLRSRDCSADFGNGNARCDWMSLL